MNPLLKRIFCVDDDKDILEVLQLSLQTVGGFETESCSKPELAVEQIVSAEPDLVLLDVMMPNMDGLTVLAKLRDVPSLENLPVIYMTARTQTHDIDTYLNLGAAGIITKPFDPMSVSTELEAIWRSALSA